MKRTIEDVLENLDFVGCDNDTARELCDEIERLQQQDAKLREELSVWLKCYQEEKRKREELVKRVREALSEKT